MQKRGHISIGQLKIHDHTSKFRMALIHFDQLDHKFGAFHVLKANLSGVFWKRICFAPLPKVFHESIDLDKEKCVFH